jgi:hypothetical protein
MRSTSRKSWSGLELTNKSVVHRETDWSQGQSVFYLHMSGRCVIFVMRNNENISRRWCRENLFGYSIYLYYLCITIKEKKI